MPRRLAIRTGHVIAFDGRGHRLLRDGAVSARLRPAGMSSVERWRYGARTLRRLGVISRV